MRDQIHTAIAVAPFVVIPRHQLESAAGRRRSKTSGKERDLDEGRRQHDAGFGVDDGGAAVGDEIGRHDGVLRESSAAMHQVSMEVRDSPYPKMPFISPSDAALRAAMMSS